MTTCRECKKDMPEPTIVGDSAFQVCEYCGATVEIDLSQLVDLTTRIEQFEAELGIALPHAYLSYVGLGRHSKIALPKSDSALTTRYFSEGVYEVSDWLSLSAGDALTIFDGPELAREWDLPSGLLPFEGNGHVWLAFDYRNTSEDPPIVLIESDTFEFLTVAENFQAFVGSLEAL